MTVGDKAKFAAEMKVTADLYGKPELSLDALRLFFMLMEPYSIKQFENALHKHMTSSPFMPKPCDIISRIDGTAEDRAALAWPKVLNAISKAGHYHSIAFPAPEYNYAITMLGGWVRLCTYLLEAEEKWRGKDFERFFVLGDKRVSWTNAPGKIRVERYCTGQFELNNRARGYALPDVIDAETCLPMPDFRQRIAAEIAPGLQNAQSAQGTAMIKDLTLAKSLVSGAENARGQRA